MARPLDGKRSAKRVAMVLALGLLGAVLALMFTLLYILYWVKAPVPLPEPALLMLPEHDAWLVIRPDVSRAEDRETLRVLLGTLLRDAPRAARRAARYGLAEERAGKVPMQVSLSLKTPDDDETQWVGAVSLGRYRGAFWLAERALRRQAKEGGFPYSKRPFEGASLYEATPSHKPGPAAMGIWRATGVAGNQLDLVAGALNALESGSPPEGSEISAEFAAFGKGRILRPDAVLEAWLKGLLGESADPGPLRGALQSIEIDLHAKEGGALLFKAVCPWREGANRAGASRAISEIMQLSLDSGQLAEFSVHSGEFALEARALIVLQ